MKAGGAVDASWQGIRQNVELVRSGWHSFHSGIPAPSGVRAAVLRSWERSLQAGLSPVHVPGGEVWSATRLQDAHARNASLIAAAGPIMNDLQHVLEGNDQVLVLCDAAARVLLVDGPSSARAAAETIGLSPGSDWHERISGTNAMGTALAEGTEVTIFATEHYVQNLHLWSCVAAPIRHPATGEMLGIFDLSGRFMTITPHTEMAVLGAVRAIEARLAVLEATRAQVRPATRTTGRPPAHATTPATASPANGLVGANPAWLAALERATRVARTDSTVLISGETGTGKEVLARAIHRASPRAAGPFVAINCGAMPPNLILSELFGYVAGAFTGASPKGAPGKVEAANGGTLFLDEVSELPPEAQVSLLRVLQEREVVRIGSHHPTPVNVRVIAASNRTLTDLVSQNVFRQDLYYRINVVPLHLPPLRERREDILPLLEHGYRRLGAEPPALSLASCERLTAYDWPGNVRELLNLAEQAQALGEDPADLLPMAPLARPSLATLGDPGEEERIRDALAIACGNAAAAARALGMSRSTLYRKLELYDIRLGRQVK
jgi:sigma-54 dependent transcriptional regulator, acetoin dehydrogenase operon transcriptional activator AcoR